MKTNKFYLIQLMLMETDIFTYNDIAKKASVSNKTIRNNMSEMTDFLQEHHIQIKKSPGVGIELVGDKLARLECYKACEDKMIALHYNTAEIRQDMILYMLLNGEKKLTISKLEKQLYITRPSLYNDLKIIEKHLAKYDIQMVKDKKKGMILLTGEKRIRHCLLDLCFKLKQENLHHYYLVSELTEFIHKTADSNTKSYRCIRKFIHDAMAAAHTTITVHDLERAVIFMMIAFERMRNRHYVSLSAETIDKVKNKLLTNFIENHIAGLFAEFSLDVNPQEVVYITAQLSAYMTASYENLVHESSDPSGIMHVIDAYCNMLKEYVMYVDHAYLKNNLFPLLENAMQKSNFEFDFYNPNTALIKEQYASLYGMAKLINIEMEKQLCTKLPAAALATITLLLADMREKHIGVVKCCYISQESGPKQNLALRILKNSLPHASIKLLQDRSADDMRKFDVILCSSACDDSGINGIVVPELINEEFIRLLIEKIFEIRKIKLHSFIRTNSGC